MFDPTFGEAKTNCKGVELILTFLVAFLQVELPLPPQLILLEAKISNFLF